MGLLRPLPLPTRPWTCIAINFEGPLPKVRVNKQEYDLIMAVIDRLTSMVHLVPLQCTATALDVAKLFFKYIFPLHGLPKEIVSDRDSRFTSKFWQQLAKLTGTDLSLSTAFHQQTDGATERVNKTLLQILRHFVNKSPTNWFPHLLQVEFAMNSAINASSGHSPFKLNYGYEPTTMPSFLPKDGPVPAATELISPIKGALANAMDSILAARTRQIKHYNNRHRPIPSTQYQIGDQVLSETTNLALPPGKVRKLWPTFIGAFLIIRKYPERDNYELDVSTAGLTVHPIFHASLIKPYKGNAKGDDIPEPVPMISVPATRIERMISDRKGLHGKEYLVHYSNTPDEDDSWVPHKELQEKALGLLLDYTIDQDPSLLTTRFTLLTG